MPYETIWEDEGVYWRFFDQVTGREILQANLDIYMDCRFRSLKYQILNFLESTDFDITAEDVASIAAYDNELAGGAPEMRVAIVATREEIDELHDVYDSETVHSPWETGIFRELREARGWVLIREV